MYNESDIKIILSRLTNNDDVAQIQPVMNSNQTIGEPQTVVCGNSNPYGCAQYSQCVNSCTVLGSTCVNYKDSQCYDHSCSNWLQNYASSHSHRLME